MNKMRNWRNYLFLSLCIFCVFGTEAKTLIVYYSYTDNVHKIVSALTEQIECDVVRIQPKEKGLDYLANNYAIGSAQISAIRNNPDDASSYPAIDPVNIEPADYDCVIIGTPLWWSQMAAPLQSYLFQNGKAMAGKKIGLIVSSASSGISGVESDARRLIPNGDFLSPSLWIRSSQTSSAATLLEQWLIGIDYDSIVNNFEVAIGEAVDLGLSVKWASFNIGATEPAAFGMLYGWGDTTGKLTSENLDDYPTANPPATICGTEYDIAKANWGDDWRMPTQTEFEELVSGCKWEWTVLDEIPGMKVTGQNGNSIFLPAAASRTGETISNQVGQRGCYWSGTLWPTNPNFASYLYFYSNADNVQAAHSNRRYIGMSVRAVYDDPESGIHSNEVSSDNFFFQINDRTITVNGIPTESLIEILDIAGRQIYLGKGCEVTLNQRGLYLVRANGKTKKIFI